ncbi:Bug family tripartite tricarboxylate transporter substrate binding protein [Parapusillimonas granuli]|uniref:Tripartite tricarboxylate transporter substrate binding protein n=1 Tax=Parapusillimonas granuli TaxID=380911 RepID=A0A853FWT6_9BURK|nr:tripartite tricarboxylate transporter substrate binding protein [Parapusillimonas granuli]MBB5216552.1 tripartite-type tricarboxylate transporter receptor subunit TctC [Parapusillimonas granuli]MEB2399705.1 tripartite tricarboxylate transporter substrate binding protein [Alcaligenaceae bacterium]NYT48142.1 tripartite tricarboxylate transporter substrate binding protein [Parapusillimonas granuli]
MQAKAWRSAAVGLAGLCTSFSIAAAAYPAGPVSTVISFPPGNSADLVGRTIAQKLQDALGQPFVVDNKGGAGGIIGIEYVTRAKPDGYTITVTSLSPVSVIPAVKKVPYDPVKQLAPISLLAQGPMVIVVRKDSPFNTLQELIDHARANPGKLNYGSLGPGTISQMTTELFKSAAGIELTEIPYKGSAQALTDLIGGQIQVLFDGMASAMRQIDAGTVKGLAVTIPQRSPMMPDTPSIAETGIPGLKDFQSQGWMGAFAPAGTPPEVIARLHKEMQDALKSPDVIERFAASGLLAVGSDTPADFARFVEADFNRWSSAAQMLGLRPTEK